MIRKVAGAVIAAMALAVLVFGIEVLAADHPMAGPLVWWESFITQVGPLHTVTRTLPAAGVRSIAVDAPVAQVMITTGSPNRVGVFWTSSAGLQKALRVSRSGSLLTVRILQQGTAQHLGTTGRDLLLVLTVPQGIDASVHLAAGTVHASGDYGRTAIRVQAGTVTLRNIRATLSAQVDVGTLTVTGARMAGPMQLGVKVGPIRFSGDPGPQGSITDGVGPVTLAVAPSHRLSVHVQAQGPVKSGFASLQGQGGTLDGSIGHGSGGDLNVIDNLGPVSIGPLQ